MPATPYDGRIFGGQLRFYPEELAKKIPMGFNSKKSYEKWMKIAMWQIEFGLR
jgi:hypothetical protein